MASAEQLLVRIDASTEQLRREFARADASIEQFDRKTRRSLGQLDGSLRKIDAAFASLSRGLGVFVGGLAVNQVVRFGAEIAKTADQLRLLEARVKVLGGTAQTFEQLRAVSLKLGTSVESTAGAFSRFRVAGDDIGLTNRQVITLTETVQKLGRIGGASGQELAAATQQFAQGLAKGRLDGDELRSVLENLPLLGKAIADSLGVGVGQLRDMGAAGQLTGKVISDAVLAVAEKTDEQFQRLPRTLEQASTNLETEWGRLVTVLDNKLSVSRSYQFFLDQLGRGVAAAADAIAPSTLQKLQSTLDQLRAIQEQIERAEQQPARPSERGLADPRRQDSDRTAAQRIAKLKEEAAALAELLQREAEHIVNQERLEQVQRQATVDKNAADRLKAVNDLIASYERETEVLRLSDIERKKREAADKAEADARKKIAGITDEQVASIRAAASAAAVEADAIERGRKSTMESAKEREALNDARTEAFADIQEELRYVTELAEAHGIGAEAVRAVEDARKADLIIQRLKIDENSTEADQIRELIVLTEDQRAKIDAITDAHKEAERAAEKALAEQKKAAEDARREYEKLVDSIANVSQEKLGDALFDALKGETLDFAEFLKDTLLRAIADIAAAALTRQIVIPIAAQVIGAAPGLFGLSGGAAQVASQAAGGGMGINPLSFLNGGGLYNQFAFSGLGQSLGLSYGAGTLATNAGLFAAGSGALGTFAAGGPAALALTGPAGGFGTIAGLSTASTGGAVGAATAGGALGASGGLTGLGASLGAAMPYIGIGLAALSILGPMLFKGNPSVGPVGIADFSPGLGRRKAFDVDGIDPFTADNGGNGESLRPIAEAIADLIADSADRFSATIDESLRFRVANYGGPQKGSGRDQGFEVNAFIRGEAEKRVAEGLSQEQAVFEALKFAVQEAFTFDSATIAEAAANTAGTTTEEILADLDFAQNFERLGDALIELGGFVDANTLAQAQQTVALLAQAEAFAAQNAAPITDALEKARELFPASRSGQETVRQTIRGVVVPTDFDEGAARGSRFVQEGTDEFDRLVADGARVVSRVEEVTRAVTISADNYAANMSRVALSVDIAKAGMALLVDQITGDFEPTVRGPFQSALEQGRANLDALRVHMEDVNAEITAANAAFPGLSRALIDVAAALTDAEAALLANLRDDFRQQVADALDPSAATLRAFVEAATSQFTDAMALGLGDDRTLMRDLFETFGNGLQQTGLSVVEMVRALADLEIAAAQAGISVDGLADQALANLRGDFNSSIQAQMNEAQGLGVLNTIRGLVDARGQNAADAASLGLDVNATAGTLFDAQLRNALAGAGLADLQRVLGSVTDAQSRGVIQALMGEQALALAREQTAAATVEQIAGMQELADQAERFAAAANDNARTLRQAAQGLLVDPNLSPLSPELRLQEARRQFEAAFGLANDNDPTDEASQDAISRLPGLSQTMLEASKAYYGSTEGYLADFNRAQEYLNNTALRQESIEQQQLDALRNIESAITAAGGSNLSPSQQAAQGGFNFGVNTSVNQQIYDALSAAGLPTPSGFGSGQLSALRQSNAAVNALVSAMGFATGGSFTVAGPAGNDNLLMPLRLTAGEAVSVSRQDSMAAMASELRAARAQAAETAAINKALLHEVTQLRVQNARWAQADMKSARRVSDMQAAQPRRAYGT